MIANFGNKHINNVKCQNESADYWAWYTVEDETSTSNSIALVVVNSKVNKVPDLNLLH